MEFGQGKSAMVVFDSKYAAKACTGKNRIAENKILGTFSKYLLHYVRGNGVNVVLEHVKGHSGNPGNEKADQLANEGAIHQEFKGGRFADGPGSITFGVFEDFLNKNCQISQYYCDCFTNGRAVQAK